MSHLLEQLLDPQRRAEAHSADRRAAITPPCGLLAAAVADAATTYRLRMDELDELRPLLERLQPDIDAAAKTGLTLYPSNVSMSRELVGEAARRHRVVRLQTGGLFSEVMQANRWLAVLRERGFVEVSRRDPTTRYGTALLRKGALLVRVDAPAPMQTPARPTPAAPAEATAAEG